MSSLQEPVTKRLPRYVSHCTYWIRRKIVALGSSFELFLPVSELASALQDQCKGPVLSIGQTAGRKGRQLKGRVNVSANSAAKPCPLLQPTQNKPQPHQLRQAAVVSARSLPSRPRPVLVGAGRRPETVNVRSVWI